MLNVHSIETFGTHEGPGIRLVIFLQGCNFRCLYCHNVDTQNVNTKAKQMSSDDVIELLKKEKEYFKDKGGLTVSGGEPTLQVEGLVDLFKKAKKIGFRTALDTNGSLFTDQVCKLYEYTDLVLLDIKHINLKWHKKITGFSNENVLKTAEYLETHKKKMWLRYVLVPGYSDQEEYLYKWGQHFKDYKYVERVEILPYHTLGVYKYKLLGKSYPLSRVKPPTADEVEKAKGIFLQYFNKVYIR